MKPKYIPSPLGDAFIEARDSALSQLRDWQQGWRPAQPDARHSQLAAFFGSLSAEQQVLLPLLVAEFTDAALYKLVCTLEQGFPNHRFRLSAVCEETGVEQKFIEDEVDHDLIHEFFDWVHYWD